MAEVVTDENGDPRTSKRVPPEVSVEVLEDEDLPGPSEAKPWEDIKKDILPVDILSLTVKDCEFLSFLSFLNKGFVKSYHKILGYVYFGDIGDDDTLTLKIAVLKCKMGSSGPGGSLVVIPNAVPILRPKAVFCVGFCGGLNETKAKLGDVVVCSKLITYAFIKHTNDRIEERGVIVPLKRDLANLIKDVGAGWKAPLKNAKDLKVKVRNDGVFLSGPEVVDDKERRDQLIKRFPEATAIEMEGEGLYAAAHDLDIEWIVIKGVSDFADGNKSDTDAWRPFASVMAASVVAHILKDAIVFQNWPHYKTASVAEESATGKRRSSSPHSSDTKRTKATTAKSGNPSKDELEELSHDLGDKWEDLGRRLGFEQAALTAFHKENERLVDKAHRMLIAWKRKEGSDASYQALSDALCHKLVGLKELAETFCS